MKRLFNKTFFKFVTGFVGIVVAAMLGVLILGTYETGAGAVPSIDQQIVE